MTAAITLPAGLRTLQLEPLFALSLDITSVQKVGASAGVGVVGVVGGGRFEGSRLRGRVLEGGSDWQQILPDGSALLDCRIVLQTDEGALVAMSYQGVRTGSPDVLARLAAGEQVAPVEYYLRINPVFQTNSPELDWLNRIVAVGTGQRSASGPTYNVFEVL